MFRFACSVALRGGRGAADRYRWPVRGALAVFRPHWVCLAQGCVLHVYTAQAPGCSMGAGPALRAVPVFGSSTKARIRLCLRFVPSLASAAQAARGLGALSPGAVRLFPPRRAARAARGLGAFSPGAAHLFSPWRAAQAARGLGALSLGVARLFPPRRVAGAARGLGALSLGAARLFPPRRVAGAARGLGALSPGAARLFPPRPQRATVGCLGLGLFSGAGR